MNETAMNGAGTKQGVEQDATANRAIRGVASTPSPQHIIPADVVAFLYGHVDFMRAEFFGGALPEVVLSFDVTDRRTLGHYHLSRNGLGVRWAVNLNCRHRSPGAPFPPGSPEPGLVDADQAGSGEGCW